MSHQDHREAARDTPVRCAVVTVSDTRTKENDTSGRLLCERIEEAGHTMAAYHLVPDEPDVIRKLAGELTSMADAVLINGGTGLSRRDRTYEAVSGLLEKELPGFGELFRMLSYEEIGAGAMLSRATAGLYEGTLLFSMPGSTGAVRLAVDALILPELEHLAWEVVRQQDEG